MPVYGGLLREAGQSYRITLAELHLQAQHHRDIVRTAGRRGLHELRQLLGMLLCQRTHHDSQVLCSGDSIEYMRYIASQFMTRSALQ